MKMGVPDINTSLVQVDFEVFGRVQGKQNRYDFRMGFDNSI